jgi:phosphatidate cytidylyltransferase
MMLRIVVIYLSAFVLGGIGLRIASRKQPPAIRRTRLVKFITYFCIVNSVLFAALAGNWVFTAMVLAIAVLGARELYPVLLPAAGGSRVGALAISFVYVMVAAGAAAFAWFAVTGTALFVFLVVCTFDGFSQVSGQLFGKHPLAPASSPGKTVEGSVGGLLLAVGMAVALRSLIGSTSLSTVVAACYISVSALAGDLLASLIKRRSGIKDFGNLLPGHGGILDRFDSFLATAAACFVLGLAGQIVQQMIN